MTAASAPGAFVARRDAYGRVSVGRVQPFSAASALVGQSVSDAVRLTAYLHALCPHAHAIALQQACETAMQAPQTEEVQARRGYALLAEAAGAAAFRFGALWPMLLGHRPDAAAGKTWRAAQGAAQSALSGALDVQARDAAHHGLKSLVQPGGLAGRLIADAAVLKNEPDPVRPARALFDRLPELLQDARILTQRLMSAVGDQTPALLCEATGDGRARAEVDVVRGRLSVDVSVMDGRVRAYAAQTPTDRVMAPDGPLVVALTRVQRASTAPLVVMALDPCAPVALDIAPLPIGVSAHA